MAKMTWDEAQSLDESLLSLDDFFDKPPQIAETLTGGLTNRCWRIVSYQGESYVWRPDSLISHQFGISRVREYKLLESLKSHQFAPKPILLNDKGLLVEWLNGNVASFPIGEAEIIGTLCRIHAVNIHNKPVPLFSFTAKVDGYWHRLDDALKTADFHSLYRHWRVLPSLPPVDPTLCHLDLGHYNLIRADSGIKVIDWEYSGVADPRLDLAMTIDLAQINMPKAVANYCKLRNISDIDSWLMGVNQWQPRNQMMAMLWYLLGYQLWQDDSYLAEAEKIKRILSRD